jgi:protein PhnA
MHAKTKHLSQVQQRQYEVSWLGKDLTRRSRSSCELCSADHTRLRIFEVAPIPETPSIHHCVFVCETCHSQLISHSKLDGDHWRCLHTAAWSIIPAIQVTAVNLLTRLQNELWARLLLEQIYLPPEVEDWLERSR